MVQNLPAGGVKFVAANEIRHNVHIYRTNQGSSSAGAVGWQPNNGQLQMQDVAVGHTVMFHIGGQAGMIANGCPSVVQLLWDNALAADAEVAAITADEVLSAKRKDK